MVFQNHKNKLAESWYNSWYNSAIPTLQEAVKKTVIAYSYATNYCKNLEETLSPALKEQLLQDKNLLPDLLSTCFTICDKNYSKAENTIIKSHLQSAKKLHEIIDEILTKLALN